MKSIVLNLFLVSLSIFLGLQTITATTYSPIYYSYNTSNNGSFIVYVQIKDSLYAMFNLNHEINESHNKNLWRIKDSYFSINENNQMKKGAQILTPGENEFVWFSGRPNVVEATGGYHGNERIDTDETCYVGFYADEKQLSLDKNIELTPCTSFYYKQRSTMHQTGTGGLITSPEYIPIDNLPIECFHEKTSIFEDGGFTTNNILIWSNNNAAVKRVYYGIFCVTREVSKKGYIDNNEPNPNILTFTDDGLFKLKSSNNQRIIMFNEDIGKSVICDSKVISGGDFKLETSIWDHRIYHKYYSKIENSSLIYPKDGDVWETTAKIKYDIIAPPTTSNSSLYLDNNIKYEIMGNNLIIDSKEAMCYDLMGNSLLNINPNSSPSIFKINLNEIYILKSNSNVKKIITTKI